MTEYKKKYNLQSAWILHRRPYRESSVIANLLTRESGLVAVVVRGVRSQNRKRRPLLMQPFTRIETGFHGKGELKTLKNAETDKQLMLEKEHLYCGLYANELLIRLLKPQLSCENIWSLYEWLLNYLDQKKPVEPALRLFEKKLLEHLGYALPLAFEAGSSHPLQPKKNYNYIPRVGFIEQTTSKDDQPIFPGWLLVAYEKNRITEEALPWLKQLNRITINDLLEGKQLHSRQLFKKHDVSHRENITQPE